jgi:hypothetical protein
MRSLEDLQYIDGTMYVSVVELEGLPALGVMPAGSQLCYTQGAWGEQDHQDNQLATNLGQLVILMVTLPLPMLPECNIILPARSIPNCVVEVAMYSAYVNTYNQPAIIN